MKEMSLAEVVESLEAEVLPKRPSSSAGFARPEKEASKPARELTP